MDFKFRYFANGKLAKFIFFKLLEKLFYYIRDKLLINLFNKAALEDSKKKASNKDSELDEISKIWMRYNICETCPFLNIEVCR